MENWKTITEYPNYEVSDLGHIRRVGRKHNLKPFYDSLQEYGRVMLFNEKGKRKIMVHILVAQAFLGERPEGVEIDHLNTNLKDNRAENLAYVSARQNRANPVTKFNREVARIRKAIASGKKSQEEIMRLVAVMKAAI